MLASSNGARAALRRPASFPADQVTGDPDALDGRLEAVAADAGDLNRVASLIKGANLVISLLPPPLHPAVGRQCLNLGVHLLTASYVAEPMAKLDREAREKKLLFLNECGLDPGIDHLSAMRVMARIRAAGGELVGFETFTGGLLAPNADANPWDYKFTWNPRNVVLAGQGGSKFIQNRQLKYIPYHRLFLRTGMIHLPGYGYFEGYGNRDSLTYLDVYGVRE